MALRSIDILGISKTIYDALKGVSENVFVNEAPKAVPEKLKDYIIVDACSSVSYQGTCAISYAVIYLFVRDKQSGVQNTTEVSRLTNEVLGLFPFVAENITMLSPDVSVGKRVSAHTRVTIRCEIIIK